MMMDSTALDRVISQRLDSSLRELARLCAQPSISATGVGMEECAELVVHMLMRRGFETQIIDGYGPPLIFASRQGQGDRTLLFYNHYDVQPPEPLDLWESPPFEPTIRDGKMFARGVSDDKGHIQCRLAAIDAILEVAGDVPCNLKFIIEGAEETGSGSLPNAVAEHQELLSADACLWEFGGVDHEGNPVQVAGLRGILYVELSVKTASKDSHSGLGGSIFPNAAWRITWALASLKGPDELIRLPGFYEPARPPSQRDLELLAALPDQADHYLNSYGLDGFIKGLEGGLELTREAIFSPACTICGLASGYQGPGTKTVLPAEAKAKVGFRLVPDQHPDQVLAQLRHHLDTEGFPDIKIENLGGEPPARTDPDDPFIQLVVSTAEPVYGVPQLIQPFSGGSGPNHPFIHVLGLPVATAGVGYPGSNAHAPNENLVIDLFEKGIRHTARIIQGFSRM